MNKKIKIKNESCNLRKRVVKKENVCKQYSYTYVRYKRRDGDVWRNCVFVQTC